MSAEIEESNGKARPKRPRIRVNQREQQLVVIKRQVYANPRAKQELYSQPKDDELTFLNKIKDADNSPYIIKHKSRCRDFLYDIVSKSDAQKLKNSNNDYVVIQQLLRKYNKRVCWEAVKAQAKVDCKIYCSGDVPDTTIKRTNEERLQTMEMLTIARNKGRIDEQSYNRIWKQHFSDVISKDAMANAAEIGMLRAQAVGHVYNDKNGWSQEYYQVNKNKGSKKYNPEDYDLFGYNGRGEPLCATWHAVEDSKNFRYILPQVQKNLSELGVAPEVAYKFNHYDFADIITKSGGLVLIKEAPYKEFCKKFGILLQVGCGMFSETKNCKIWEATFATKDELNMNDDDRYDAYRSFERNSQRVAEKIKNDFAKSGVSQAFFEAWVDNMVKTGTYTPESVNWNKSDENIPHKIEIHHNQRLSDGGKNDLKNFSLIVMFKPYDLDVHASKHQGESKNFILEKNLAKEKSNEDNNVIYQSSNYVSIRSEYFYECSDKCEVIKPFVNTQMLKKSAELKKRIKPATSKKLVTKSVVSQYNNAGYV